MKTELTRHDWDFDNVPNNELVGCCYWEFARESTFIRELRRRSWEHWRPLYVKGQWWNQPEEKQLHADIERAQSIGAPSEVFLRGICCPPDGVLPDALPLKPGQVHKVTGSFPKPWQDLTKEERAYRAYIRTDAERIPLEPFARGHFLDARDIVECVTERRREAQAKNERVKRQNPHKTDEALCREGKLEFPDLTPALYWEGGREMTVVAIEWAAFTNEEIIQAFRLWLKKNRPDDLPGPNSKGHKPGDWRAQLTRLAVMRLLSRHTALDLVAHEAFPAIWKTKQFAGRKWADVTKWYDARREAAKFFHRLFPFLAKQEKPLSWVRQPPGK